MDSAETRIYKSTDDKLEKVYEYIRLEKENILKEVSKSSNDLRLEIEKAESRNATRITEKLASLKELIDTSNTLRQETSLSELTRMQKESAICAGKCDSTKLSNISKFEKIDDRLNALELWKKLNLKEIVIYGAVAIVALIQVSSWMISIIRGMEK